jgi:hypothetical protein
MPLLITKGPLSLLQSNLPASPPSLVFLVAAAYGSTLTSSSLHHLLPLVSKNTAQAKAPLLAPAPAPFPYNSVVALQFQGKNF